MSAIDVTKDLSALFIIQARATPDAVALEDESRKLTYAQLEEETGALAEKLRRHGVGRDVSVGILLGRSADYVVACLATLRAGGAFLVLELAYPPGLLADVIADAQPRVVITHTAYLDKIKSDTPLIILDLPDPPNQGDHVVNGSSNENGELSPLPSEDDLERLAFISYSSGTTGLPKGIANPHRAAVLSYNLRFGLSGIRPGDRVAANVFFIWEMLRPLLLGGTVFAVPDENSYDPVTLVDLLAYRGITETLMTPTLLATVLAQNAKLGSRLPELRTIWLNGEVVTADLACQAMRALPNTRLLNCYSASETHEIACGDIREILDENANYCPVGLPLDPEHTYILDEDGHKVELGASGELYVGGELLARGYLNLPETTAKSFISDTFSRKPSQRMYRTGDLARLLPSGALEITGRVGSMIKVRGYSVQPGAVENAIMKHLAVCHSIVVAHGDGLERQLVAYIVHEKYDPGDRTIVTIEDSGYSPTARKTLVQHLAHYMIPAIWIAMEELPTHDVSGKVDLKGLPDPNTIKSRSATSNQLQSDRDTNIRIEEIARMWAASLNLSVNVVTQDHDFFDLGGHSLALADLARRLSHHFGFPVPLARLAGNPTLAGHLEELRTARDGHTAAVQADLPAILRADSTLPDDIQTKGHSFCPLKNADKILLTGATGYLGAFLLKSLVKTTTARIICLVRFTQPNSESGGAGMARIRKNLLDLGIWHDSIVDRLTVLPGNLGRKDLGLTRDNYDQLIIGVNVIIHCAATVNLVYPYAAMRSANVFGTREILRLASLSGATFHYISTNGVLPPDKDGWTEDAMLDIKDVPERIADGYGQTKWVAEQLVIEATRRGLPAKIYRPGTISGHSILGSTNTYDLLTALMIESIHIGYAPNIEGWLAEMTPVDFVSDAIVTLCNDNSPDQHVYHLGDPDPAAAGDLFDILARLGYPTERLEWDAWVSLWNKKRGTDKAGDDSFTAGILRRGMPSAELLKAVSVLKTPATQSVLSRYGVDRPKTDDNLLTTYCREFYGRGWLSHPPRRASGLSTIGRGPLSGRVAVVTGASSGIGAAVSSALVAEGAHIVLAARRVDILEDMKRRFATKSATVLIQKTDVTDRAQVESLMKTAREELGPIDILVSCAGVMYFTMMTNVKTDEWERTVDVNCKGLLHCLSSTVPEMVSRGKGHIVAISSDAGRKVFPGLGVYSASKFFVEAMLQSLRLETANSGLRVTSIQPGNTATDLLGMSTDEEAIKKYGEPTGAKILNPEDVAASIIYALRQPEHVAVNEILVEPREEPI